MSRIVKAISVLLALALLLGLRSAISRWRLTSGLTEDPDRLIIFHAGSLALPFKKISEEFKKSHRDAKIVREIAGSRECARKITDLAKPCDVMASADYAVIDTLLIPDHADWNIRFARNEMVIAFLEKSRGSDLINKNNWYEILLRDDVTFGRSDPNLDPAGYRAVLGAKLAERFYEKPGLADRLLAKDTKYIHPMSAELLALLEVNELDYIFTYRSVANQYELDFITLPDEINFKRLELAGYYKQASIRLTGKAKGSFVTRVGEPIVYGVTIPKNSPNPELALIFLAFLLDKDKGGAILKHNGLSSVVPSPTDTFDKLPDPLKKFALAQTGEDRK
ncbi:MAG: extracellular solute-binding protein [Phycisphaerales bacterium]|nr:MAG: extracellular solute-binding protein [Phycisphaerales bacterium]